MTSEHPVLIVGGGLNGCTLALALAQGGLRSTLVDPVPRKRLESDQFDGRAYAMAQASCRLLQALDIWPLLADHCESILDIKVSDGHPNTGASPLFLHFSHAEIENGPMGHMIEDRYLRTALLAAIDQTPLINMISGQSIVGHEVSANGIVAKTSGDETLRARLIIGCDGRKSPTAERAGIRRNGWEYGQSSLVCAVAHEKSHENCAHQLFLPTGPLAILPLPGNRSSIVWTENCERANRLVSGSEADFLAALRPCFGDFLGEISLVGQRFAYPLGLSLAQKLVSDRLVLVGDAAHGIHPLAGQGLNLGLRDVACLAEILTDAARIGEDIGSAQVLERYQRWRRFDIAALGAVTDGINRLFSNDNPLIRTARDLGLAAVNATPSLRRNLIREAAGLNGDLPKLLNGQRI